MLPMTLRSRCLMLPMMPRSLVFLPTRPRCGWAMAYPLKRTRNRAGRCVLTLLWLRWPMPCLITWSCRSFARSICNAATAKTTHCPLTWLLITLVRTWLSIARQSGMPGRYFLMSSSFVPFEFSRGEAIGGLIWLSVGAALSLVLEVVYLGAYITMPSGMRIAFPLTILVGW